MGGRHLLVGQTSQEVNGRRPGTPTGCKKGFQSVFFQKSSSYSILQNQHYDLQVKGWDTDLGWIDSKIPKKERKSTQAWKNGRRQRQPALAALLLTSSEMRRPASLKEPRQAAK